MSKNRREFLLQIGVLGTAGMVAANNTADAKSTDNFIPLVGLENQPKDIDGDEIVELTILQTTDVHCQVHPHDELFWENGKAVFRKTGGVRPAPAVPGPSMHMLLKRPSSRPMASHDTDVSTDSYSRRRFFRARPITACRISAVCGSSNSSGVGSNSGGKGTVGAARCSASCTASILRPLPSLTPIMCRCR